MDDANQEVDIDITFDIVCGAICAFGIVGNVLVLFVNLVLKEYEKTVINW